MKIAETALAIAAGADEIDIVLNLGAFLAGDYLEASTEIEEQKATARGAHLKVILETGALRDPELIRRASILALSLELTSSRRRRGRSSLAPTCELPTSSARCCVSTARSTEKCVA